MAEQKKQELQAKVYLIEGVSQKTGRTYYELDIVFPKDERLNDRLFLKPREAVIYDLHIK